MGLDNPAPRKSLRMIKDSTEYYDHQTKGIRTMARMESFILADEMGLGKSLQALTVAAIDFELGTANRVLVVAPVSLKWNWQDEVLTHTNFGCWVLDGSKQARIDQLNQFASSGKEILIVNYEQVTAHLKELNRLRFDIVIYDEAHTIKNHKAKRTQAALGLRAKRHFIITGSPLLNQVDELWTLFHRIDPQGFPSYWQFVNRYCVKGGYQGKQIIGVKNKPELQSNLDAVMIRRLKKDVLDLPDKPAHPGAGGVPPGPGEDVQASQRRATDQPLA